MRQRRERRTALVLGALVGATVPPFLALLGAFSGAGVSASVDPFPAPLAICEAFGDRYCGPALRVSWCESRFDVKARNGQFRGLFQMGSGERARWGHAADPWTQAEAAFRYFVASGRDWSPWACKP